MVTIKCMVTTKDYFCCFYYNLESFFTDFLAYLRYITFIFEAKPTEILSLYLRFYRISSQSEAKYK